MAGTFRGDTARSAARTDVLSGTARLALSTGDLA